MVRYLLLSFLAATPATAAPTYLSCQFDRGDGQVVPLAIAVDEVSQQVTVTNANNGRSKRFPAVFSATVVRWTDAFDVSAKAENQISRTDLTYRTRTTTFDGKVIRDVSGQCAIQETPKRAF